MADERGAFGGGQPGEWTPSAGPNPGAGWAPIGGIQGRAYSPYQHTETVNKPRSESPYSESCLALCKKKMLTKT